MKILLFDNQALGMVRQWQELFFDKRYSEVDLSDNPDFAASPSRSASRLPRRGSADVPAAIDRLLADLVHTSRTCMIHQEAQDVADQSWFRPLEFRNVALSMSRARGCAVDKFTPSCG